MTQNARSVNDGLGEELENYAVYAFDIRAIRVHSPGTKPPRRRHIFPSSSLTRRLITQREKYFTFAEETDGITVSCIVLSIIYRYKFGNQFYFLDDCFSRSNAMVRRKEQEIETW